MKLQSVREFFAEHAPELEVLITEESSTTVALAAAIHGVEPPRSPRLSVCAWARAQCWWWPLAPLG